MKFKNISKLLLALLFCLTTKMFSQSAGEIAFISYNNTNNQFSFVALTDIPANTSIWFTDYGWDEDSFDSGNKIEWRHTSALPAGSVVVIDGANLSLLNSSVGSIQSGSTAINIDQSDAFFALLTDPTEVDQIFLAGISNDLNNPIYITGTGLTEGVNFFNFEDDVPAFEYNGNRDSESDFADYLPLIMQPTNWTQTGVINATEFTIPEEAELPSIVISEIMYNSPGTDDEWIEIYNADDENVDISDWTINNSSSGFNGTFTFPPGTTIEIGEYLTIAIGSDGDGTFNNDNPFTPDFNNLNVANSNVATTSDSSHLRNSSSTFTFKNTIDEIVDIVAYNDDDGDSTDGNGDTFEIIDANADNSTTSINWQVSGIDGGSPKGAGSGPSVWIGAVSNDWTTSGNWRSPIGVPSTTSDVVIADDLSNYPTISNSITVNTILIKSGATFIANSNFTGTVTYERNLSTTNWYMVSSPVSGEDMTSMKANNDFALGTGGGRIGFAPYNSNSESWDYYTNSSTDALIDGKAYTTKLSEAGNISFSGTLNTDNSGIDITLSTEGSRFNALGNPYTSYINSTTFLNSESSISDTQNLWLWNQALGANGAYEVLDATDGFVIAPAQGFFVKANVSGGTFNFDESNQSHNNSDTFQKTSSNPVIKLWVDNEDGLRNYSRIKYSENATKSFDVSIDGELYEGQGTSFAIYSHLLENNNGKNYQVQSLPNQDFEKMVVPIGIIAEGNKEVTFSSEITNLPTGLKVFIEDREQNTITRIDEENSNYTVFLDEDLDGVGRFYLHTTSAALSTDDVILEGINIYATNKNTLRVSGVNSSDASIKIFNILGKKVLENSFTSRGVADINLPNLTTGVYIVQLATEKGKATKKIILE